MHHWYDCKGSWLQLMLIYHPLFPCLVASHAIYTTLVSLQPQTEERSHRAEMQPQQLEVRELWVAKNIPMKTEGRNPKVVVCASRCMVREVVMFFLIRI